MKRRIEELSGILVTLGGDAGDDVDWGVVESEYRVGFPADYKKFVQIFGNGTIEGMIGIKIPIATSDPMVRRVAPLPASMLADPAFDEWAEPGLEGACRLDQILVWGETDSADTLAWIASEKNPDKWPVVVYKRSDAVWRVYDCGVIEFLAKLLKGEFAECPISDSSLMDISSPRFLHDREEERLAEQGLYPWGED